MMKLEIFYPFKFFMETQKWGNVNSAYEQFGFKRHNGIDCRPYNLNYQPEKYPVYCPVSGFTVYQVRNHPQGGGNEIWLISKEKVTMFERECRALMVLAHADKVLVPVGHEPKLGELIMIGDNTGFSTGPHTHMGLYRVDYDGIKYTYLDENEAKNSFDPALFFTKQYSIDKAPLSTLLTNNMRYFQYILGK